jgi:ABC-type transporter Mla subunit MlaD
MTSASLPYPGGAPAESPGAPESGGPIALRRWLFTWIVFGLLVVLTVIGYLIGIVHALSSINGGLVEAANSVTAIGGDADPLPASLQTINTNLSSIDGSLKPIPGQATDISGGLTRIRDSLKSVDASLKNSSGSLADTDNYLADTAHVLVGVAGTSGDISHSLTDTANVLDSVKDRAGHINDTLHHVQHQGTSPILGRVKDVNGILGPVQDDTHTVNGQLGGVNQNLTAICQSPVLMLLPPLTCGR